MDSAVAYCAGGPGLIPAVGKSKSRNIQMIFRQKVVGKMEPDTRKLRDLASP